MPPTIEPLTIEANGLTFFAAAAGPSDGPLVLLLHGFPEFSYAWRHQLAPLADAGWRAVAPDQRGYARSDKPVSVDAYRIDTLVDDVLAIATALGHERFALVGHDWGGIVAWRLAADHPERVLRLAILNAPNLDVAWTHALTHPTQLLRSAYVAFFQSPLLPELVLSSMDHALLARALSQSSRPGAFTDEDLDRYREAWAAPGALTAMLGWYRALPRTPMRAPRRISVPTLVLWGDDDNALDRGLAERSASLCDDVEVVHRDDATHWIHHEHPDDVLARLRAFLAPVARRA